MFATTAAQSVPSMEHILWKCSHPTYRALRTRPKPRSDLRSRLGWSPNAMPFQEEVALIPMMGDVRKSEVPLRRQRASSQGWCGWSGGPGVQCRDVRFLEILA